MGCFIGTSGNYYEGDRQGHDEPVTQRPSALCVWNGQDWAEPSPTEEQIIASLTTAVQSHLDASARARGYDGILSAASYAGDSHPPFDLEGVAFRDWRGAVWAACYGIMADVQGGMRPVPDAATLIAELPLLVLP